ncbi:unnamed protein product [Schistosoma curassoni]|nr:unnamed protein product [Schistosoma curassoni]
MKLFFISIIGIFSLLISQEYGYTVDINLNDAKQKQHLITKLNSLNQYLQSRGINKQFTEDEFYKIIYDRLNKHIEDEKSDVRIIEKVHSISDIFFFNKPWIPLWIVNPLYYIAEKFVQLMAFLLVDDNIRELQMPEYYYDTSI